MASLRSLVLLPLICLISLNPCRAETSTEGNASDLTVLGETVQRYFSGMGGYQEGDLLSRSQVQELQDYLKKTRGHSPATHPWILSRVLADNSRLVRLFYRHNGAELLREAVAKGNGYEVFKSITHTSIGYSELVDAVERGAVEDLIQMANQKSQQQADALKASDSSPKKRLKPPLIYTATDYIAAVTVAMEKSAADAAAKASQP